MPLGSAAEHTSGLRKADSGRELHAFIMTEGYFRVPEAGRPSQCDGEGYSAGGGSVIGGGSGIAPGPRYTMTLATPTPDTGGISDTGRISMSSSS